MNSVCEDCFTSYCSCSISTWKDEKRLQNTFPEAESLYLTNRFLQGKDGDTQFQGDLGKIDQSRIFNLKSGIIASTVQDSDQVYRGNSCYLHSCCLYCYRSMTVGSSWKRSVKRKIAQVSKKEEAELVLTNAMLLTQVSDMRDCAGGQEAEKCQTLKGRENGTVPARLNAPPSLECHVHGVNGEEKCHQEESNGKEDRREFSEKQDEVKKLTEALEAEHEAINALYDELEEERNAAAIAAMETMAVISRLQKEKAAVEMEARQYQRMVEEKALYDQEAISLLKEILLRKEEEKFFLEKEVQFYQERFVSDRARSWGRENGNICGQSASGREREMLLLEGKDIDFETLDSSMSLIPYAFQKANTPVNHTLPSMTVEPLSTRPLSSNDSYNDLLKDLGDFSTERMGGFGKTQRSSANLAGRSSGKKLIDSFNSAACGSKESGDIALQEVQEEGSTSEVRGTADRLKGRTYEYSPFTKNSSSHCVFPFQGEGKQNEAQQMSSFQSGADALDSGIPVQELISKGAFKDENQIRLQTWTDGASPTMWSLLTAEAVEGAAPSDSPQQNDFGWGNKASKTFLRSVQPESMEQVLRAFTGSVEKNRDTKDYDLERVRTEDKEKGSLDWEDGCSASVHDVYEVQHDHYQDSSITHLRRKGHDLEQNELEFLERYGSMWNNSAPVGQSPKASPLDAEFFSRGRMENLAQLEHSETSSCGTGLADLSVRERFGKPEPIFGSIDVDNQRSRRKHGLIGKRRQMISLSQRESSRSHADVIALDDPDDHSSHLSSDSSVAVSNHDDVESSMLTGDTSSEDKVKQLTVRLQALEEDRECLKQTILSLKKGNDEMQMLQDISKQLQQLRRTEREVKDVHESTFSSIFKDAGILERLLAAGNWPIHSQRGRLAPGLVDPSIGGTILLK
ncbi:hypothetical protein O6H91_06G093100 [Diphasiastrum complanatum]|uniref:Uncharacterized protein n=1 Tax=Diphasiastrum complanatum TaxID=34168 RepID=A0ACC2DH67_DIPCM|nr:hypothetical protein O6H91_06G093100 [Diphasiastrum complanatum]